MRPRATRFVENTLNALKFVNQAHMCTMQSGLQLDFSCKGAAACLLSPLPGVPWPS